MVRIFVNGIMLMETLLIGKKIWQSKQFTKKDVCVIMGHTITFLENQAQRLGKYHNWEGPAVEPIEGEQTEFKKEYYLYGLQLTQEEWSEARKDREGLPWYKNPSMRGTTRF
jgi:uncharacterized protein YecA (UPF0149 family)